jgi:hypothetical protein
LKFLSLRGNFGDPAWEQIGQMSSLISLTLDSPQLTCAGIGELSNLTALQTLVLRGSGPVATDEALAVISRLRLKMLSIDRGEALTDEGLAHLAASACLERLMLQQAKQITNDGRASLEGLKLKHLQIQDAHE